MKFNALVKDVMRKDIKTVETEASIKEAARIMRDARVGSVVAVSKEKIAGIVTAKDIVYKHVATNAGSRVKDIMSTRLITANLTETIEQASRQMVKEGVERLLVFDHEKLVGIVSSSDILKVEPALVEILLERMKIGGGPSPEPADINVCESCGNYSDDIEEAQGIYKCRSCRA